MHSEHLDGEHQRSHQTHAGTLVPHRRAVLFNPSTFNSNSTRKMGDIYPQKKGPWHGGGFGSRLRFEEGGLRDTPRTMERSGQLVWARRKAPAKKFASSKLSNKQKKFGTKQNKAPEGKKPVRGSRVPSPGIGPDPLGRWGGGVPSPSPLVPD